MQCLPIDTTLIPNNNKNGEIYYDQALLFKVLVQ